MLYSLPIVYAIQIFCAVCNCCVVLNLSASPSHCIRNVIFCSKILVTMKGLNATEGNSVTKDLLLLLHEISDYILGHVIYYHGWNKENVTWHSRRILIGWFIAWSLTALHHYRWESYHKHPCHSLILLRHFFSKRCGPF